MKTEVLPLNISNNTGSEQDWHMFGASFLPTDMKVSVPTSSAEQANAETLGGSFIIKNMKVKVTDVDQFNYPIKIDYRSMTGEVKSQQIMPADYQDPANGNQKFIVIPGINEKISADIALEGKIKAHTNMTIILEIEHGNSSNYLSFSPDAPPVQDKDILQLLNEGGYAISGNQIQLMGGASLFIKN